MEEYDDLVPAPDEHGHLDLTYRGWIAVDDVIWTMGRELITLNISFNALTELAPELGDLQVLRELDVSCNKLTSIPTQVGKLKMLKVFKLNGNKIQTLPGDIGNCTKLEKILAGENSLMDLPDTFQRLQELQILQVCNNRLSRLPPSLCLLPKLKEVDIANNPGLEHMIPLRLQENTDFILWMCRLYFEHYQEVEAIKRVNHGYEAMVADVHSVKKELVEHVEKVNDDHRDLIDSFPQGCDARCFRCYVCCHCEFILRYCCCCCCCGCRGDRGR